MNQQSKLLGLATLAIAVTACAGPDVELVDDGRLCVYAVAPETPGSHGPTQAFDSNQPVFVTVTTEECISACIQNEVASCSVSRSGTTLTVRSELSYDDPPDGEACIAVCGSLTALCNSQRLPAGAYTIVHGNARHELAVPSTGVEPCF